MHLVVDEALAGVELASGLSINHENILAFHNSTAIDFRREYDAVRERGLPETRDEAQFTNSGFCGDVGRHIHNWVARLHEISTNLHWVIPGPWTYLCNVILSQGTRGYSNLNS